MLLAILPFYRKAFVEFALLVFLAVMTHKVACFAFAGAIGVRLGIAPLALFSGACHPYSDYTGNRFFNLD